MECIGNTYRGTVEFCGHDLLAQKGPRVVGHIFEVVEHNKYFDDCFVRIEDGLE